jgi:NCAIR mutase (PurE)-related protein
MSDIESYASLDYQRAGRCGFPEVVFGAGKTPEQVAAIMAALVGEHSVVLATRATPEQAAAAVQALGDAEYIQSCGLLYCDRRGGVLQMRGASAKEALAPGQAFAKAPGEQGAGASGGEHSCEARDVSMAGARAAGDFASIGARAAGDVASIDAACLPNCLGGHVVVCCAGTSDMPVAEEAALTARIMGSRVTMLSDVGIAGVHRVLAHEQTLRDARAVVAVAGMEGALPSLVAGLVDVPVIAVPTSVGYGASFGGIAALLGMLNSCASGVSVVNIDNGFGAGVIAHRVNMPPERFAESARQE